MLTSIALITKIDINTIITKVVHHQTSALPKFVMHIWWVIPNMAGSFFWWSGVIWSVIRHYFHTSFLVHFDPISSLSLLITLSFLMFIPLCFITLTTSDKENNAIGEDYYWNRIPIYWDVSKLKQSILTSCVGTNSVSSLALLKSSTSWTLTHREDNLLPLLPSTSPHSAREPWWTWDSLAPLLGW